MAPPLTTKERARICDLYRQHLQGRAPRRADTLYEVIEDIAVQVRRGWTTVQRVLVAEKLIAPPRPRGLSDRVMKAVADAYLTEELSLRACARNFKLSYGKVRAVLAYEGVELRDHLGGRAGRRSVSDEENSDLRELQRLVQRYPEQAWLAVAGEPHRVTVDDVRQRAARSYQRVDWVAEVRHAPREDLLKVIDVLTRERDCWRDRGHEYADWAGDPANTGYLTTVRIARGSVLLSFADALDEQVASELGRLDLLGWKPDPTSTSDLDDCAGAGETEL